ASEELASRDNRSVESGQQRFLAVAAHVLGGSGGNVQPVHLGESGDVARNRRHVLRELAGGHRLGMRPPFEAVGWDALQNAAGGGSLGVEFGDQRSGSG